MSDCHEVDRCYMGLLRYFIIENEVRSLYSSFKKLLRRISIPEYLENRLGYILMMLYYIKYT